MPRARARPHGERALRNARPCRGRALRAGRKVARPRGAERVPRRALPGARQAHRRSNRPSASTSSSSSTARCAARRRNRSRRPRAASSSLVADEDLDENARGQRDVEQARVRVRRRALRACASAWASCSSVPTSKDDANPMSPATICAALKDACDQIEGDFKVRMALLHQLERLRRRGPAAHLPRPERAPGRAAHPAGSAPSCARRPPLVARSGPAERLRRRGAGSRGRARPVRDSCAAFGRLGAREAAAGGGCRPARGRWAGPGPVAGGGRARGHAPSSRAHAHAPGRDAGPIAPAVRAGQRPEEPEDRAPGRGAAARSMR